MSTETMTEQGTAVKVKTLMVAYDFSLFAEAALEYAMYFAGLYSAEISVIYAISPSTFGGNDDIAFLKREHHQAEIDLQAISARVRHYSQQAKCICRIGGTADVLFEAAAELHPDILFMGAFGHRAGDAKKLGSTAEFLLRSLSCATLMIGPELVSTVNKVRLIRNILFASSLSGANDRALQLASDLALRVKAQVEIVHVTEPGSSGSMVLSSQEVDERTRSLQEQASIAGVGSHWQMRTGEMGHEILQCAKDHQSDLIVFGIEHHSSNPYVVGAISQCVREAECPVLAVPHSKRLHPQEVR
ncbi:universal stress protein [Silvibacterium acidisoli]|uniref:universal stress protein n=1 Tax=Acidobacteriaceae bacterium ZG23-2 TaxID=2883246 RepID=UPI00406C9A07